MSLLTGTQSFATNGFTLVRDDFQFDPQGLPVRNTEWQGTQPALEALAATLLCPVRLNCVKGPLWSLVATRQGPDAMPEGQPDEVFYSDKWEVRTESIQQSIFQLPLSWAAAVAYDSTNPGRFKKQLEDFAENSGADTLTSPAVLGDTTTLPAPFDAYDVGDVAFMVLQELSRGASAFEISHLTLTRARSISANFPTPMPLYPTGKIYSLEQLQLPADIKLSLPGSPGNPLPDDPAQAKWGWRLRDQQSTFLQPGRVEQTFQWALAAWSTFLYEVSTTNFPN